MRSRSTEARKHATKLAYYETRAPAKGHRVGSDSALELWLSTIFSRRGYMGNRCAPLLDRVVGKFLAACTRVRRSGLARA